jgi:hypothetical protein
MKLLKKYQTGNSSVIQKSMIPQNAKPEMMTPQPAMAKTIEISKLTNQQFSLLETIGQANSLSRLDNRISQMEHL